MNPMKKVTDPHSIKASEIPSISDANPDGVICGGGAPLRGAGASDEDGDGDWRWSERWIAGEGGYRRILSMRDDSSYKTPDCCC